jgi:predicted transcriptional regulator
MAHLGHLEAAVMDRLWTRDEPLAVREILEDLQPERPLAYTTVMTVLDNLHRKGMVIRQKSGRAYVYRPSRSRATHTADLMEQALHSSRDRGSALLRFVEKMSSEEAEELRRALAERDAGDDTPPTSARRRRS